MSDGLRSRRHFIKLSGIGAAALALPSSAAPAATDAGASTSLGLPTRLLGKTGASVSILAMGGFHLGTLPSEADAVKLVHEALDNGLTFMDSAWEYHDGKSEMWLGAALSGRREKAFLMTKLCTHGRDKRTAIEQLETSLRRLKTDHLDLWQIHEVAWPDDAANHYQKDGAIEALAQAKKDGKVRFVGFTGHKAPAFHQDMLARGFPFDTVQMPLNPFDGTHDSFEREVLPQLVKRQIGVLGMKSLSGSGSAIVAGLVTAEECLRYALSLPISAVVSGIDSLSVLRQNLAIARAFKPMSAGEMQKLRERVRDVAQTGKHELYKSSRFYEGPIGRAQHGVAPKPE